MTKTDFLIKWVNRIQSGGDHFYTLDLHKDLEKDLDECANEQAMKFAEWIQKEGWFKIPTIGWTHTLSSQFHTTEELFKMWEEQK
jgi:hypothetical protein